MLYSDEAITTNEDDLLGRDKFAKSTARALLRMTYDGTYTVGLFGKWGAGKTSLLNMILQEIHAVEDDLDPSNRTIIVHFEPWNFSSTDQLLSQFFIRLINEFNSVSDEKLNKIVSAIEKYSFAFELAKAIPIVGDAVSGAAKGGLSLFSDLTAHGANEKDITTQRDNVIRMLKEQDKRLLIVIDDIDRLSNEQIRCVFQLITSVARFPKTTYLLAFDKDIVVKALEEVQKGKGEDYLEKIIQVPIQLPYVQSEKLREVLFNRLDEVIGENPDLHFYAEHWQQLFPICVEPFIKTLRDINRLCNALRFKLHAIAEEIDFTDMTAITVLEINYPAIYEWVLSNKDVLTGDISSRLIGSYRWKREDWEKLTSDQWRAILGTDDINEIEKVTDAICALFPAVGSKIKSFSAVSYNDQRLRKGSHIGHKDKFDRYFQLSLSDESISHSDIVKVLTLLDEGELTDFFRKVDKIGKSYALLEEINANITEISPERSKIIIRALFSVSAAFDKTPRGFLALSPSRYAENLLIKLFEIIPKDENFLLLRDIVRAADTLTMETVATFLNIEELAYGRLAANGVQENYPKVLSEDELSKFEVVFTEKIKELLKNTSLLDFDDCRMIIYLLECFDDEYIRNYLTDLFAESSNIIRFLEYSTGKWIGSGVSYEIQEEYKKYLSDAQVISAIEQCRKNGTLSTLPESAQIMSAVYWLYFDNKFDYEKHISEKNARKLLDEWLR